jgi:hypothetical protein
MLQAAHSTDRASPQDALERRYCFAAWPQTYAHVSWFEWLDQLVGMPVSREMGRAVGDAELAVAQALLKEFGVEYSQRVADDYVPLWVMQAHAAMRQHLSAVAALAVLPALKLAVSGAEVRHWDAVLGAGVRHVALLLGRTHPQAEPPTHATELRRQATAAAKTATDWDRFCYQIGLTALADHNAAVRARFGLAWPRSMRELAPLLLEDSVHDWLVAVCMLSTQLQRVEPSKQAALQSSLLVS